MPIKPKRPCGKPGCPELTTGRFCEKHQIEGRKLRGETDRHYDEHQRNQKVRQFYKSRAWQAARQRALIRDHYLCQDCIKDNRITQADTVHHRVEISRNWSKRLQLSNLVSLCASCHNRRHHVE